MNEPAPFEVGSLRLLVDSGPADEVELTTADWAQAHLYPDPLWARTAEELARRISVEDFRSLYALHLFNAWSPFDGHLRSLLELAGWAGEQRYHVRMREAARPLEAGFLTRLTFCRADGAPRQPTDLAALLPEFARAEEARIGNVERFLVERQGRDARPDPNSLAARVYRLIDYPGFDNGSMGVGFALLLHGPEVHFWSRAVHYHK